MNYTRLNDEILYTAEPVTRVTSADIAELKGLAAVNPRRRVRLCAHPSAEDSLHEMLIVHSRGNYVPPHKHPGKSESFHLIDGALTVVIFDDDGRVTQSIPMGPPGGDKPFYYRLSPAWFHTVIVESDIAVFHEVTNGPFRREDAVFAPWAPGESDDDTAKRAYLAGLPVGRSDR